MIRLVKKSMCRLLAVMLMAMAFAFESFAANAKISFSDPSVKVGEEVKVTMKFTCTSGDVLGDTNVMLDYDATMLEFINETENVDGGTGKIRVRSFPGVTEAVTELRFKALRAGTATITVASWDGYDNNGQRLNMERQGTSTITVEGVATSSSDATLQNLTVSPGALTPAFTPSTENYTVTVGLDAERLTVDAQPNNSNAKVEREGGDSLQEGENTVVCRVVAEDGSTTKNYTITVNKIAGGETAGSFEGGGQATAAAEPEVLAELTSLAKKLQILSLPAGVEVPEGLKESGITISDTKVTGWIPEGDVEAPYCVFYGVNDNGIQDFYRYDRRDKTIQRYFDNANKLDPSILEAGEKYNELVGEYNKLRLIAMGGISGLALLSVILLALLLLSRRGRPEKGSGREGRGKSSQWPEEKAGGHTRTRNDGRLTKEERYMRGESDDFEEEDEEGFPSEAYQPDPAPARREAARRPQRPAIEEPAGKGDGPSGKGGMAPSRAPSPQKAGGSEEFDDFEIFDLDEDH